MQSAPNTHTTETPVIKALTAEAKTPTPATKSPANSKQQKHYISWNFTAYTEPDFKSTPAGSYPPQTLEIIMRLSSGWALVPLDNDQYWVYLYANQIYLDKVKYLYSAQYGVEPLTTINPQVVSVISQDGDWLCIKSWLGACWVDLSAPSPTAQLDVPVLSQRVLGYPTGCEIVSVAMMFSHKSIMDKDEIKTLVSLMPRSDDPNQGFRGDPSTEQGFTVFPQALLELTQSYIGSAVDMTGCELIDLRRKLDEGKPIVAWVCGMGFKVHAICLTGYDEAGFYYNNPWTGEKDAYIKDADFYAIWDKPITDTRFNITYPTRKALSY